MRRTPLPSSPAPSAAANARTVTCYRCERELSISSRAISLFCPHCHQRLVVEDLRLIGSHPGRELATCGDLIVESAAKLHLHRVVATNVLVRGFLAAHVTARGTLEIAPTGRIEGPVEARAIIVRDGGLLHGPCRILPPPRVSSSPLPPPPQRLPTKNPV
jgi:cytoskeletal protein CcmA (bactofilin family)